MPWKLWVHFSSKSSLIIIIFRLELTLTHDLNVCQCRLSYRQKQLIQAILFKAAINNIPAALVYNDTNYTKSRCAQSPDQDCFGVWTWFEHTITYSIQMFLKLFRETIDTVEYKMYKPCVYNVIKTGLHNVLPNNHYCHISWYKIAN